jgi:hypothetical protein
MHEALGGLTPMRIFPGKFAKGMKVERYPKTRPKEGNPNR